MFSVLRDHVIGKREQMGKIGVEKSGGESEARTSHCLAWLLLCSSLPLPLQVAWLRLWSGLFGLGEHSEYPQPSQEWALCSVRHGGFDRLPGKLRAVHSTSGASEHLFLDLSALQLGSTRTAAQDWGA